MRHRAVVASVGMTVVFASPVASVQSPAVQARTVQPAHTIRADSSGEGAGGVVWLCEPGMVDDPCAANRDAVSVSSDGEATPDPAVPATGLPFDCFYLYPTVAGYPSTSRTAPNYASLRVTPAETEVAISQASRFSQVCNVWAPVYRQRTANSIAKGFGADPAADVTAFGSVLAAWKQYLGRASPGKPVVLIGHSQGAAMLIRLLRSEVDPVPALRARLVSALVIGGNVVVPTSALGHGSFKHIPPCRSPHQISCVIAYSAFPGEPPRDSDFGRPGQGISLQAGQTATVGLRVVCTNPASLGGGAADLDPFFPVKVGPPPAGADNPGSGVGPGTPTWVTYPGLYSASCRSRDGASWLEVRDVSPPGDVRPPVTERLGPAWGYHEDDINLALGNLVRDVAAQESRYEQLHRATAPSG